MVAIRRVLAVALCLSHPCSSARFKGSCAFFKRIEERIGLKPRRRALLRVRRAQAPRVTAASRSAVVFEVGEALILLRRAFERAALLPRLPMNDVLNLFRQLKVFVGDAFGSVILESDFDPGVGRGDVRMMPRSLSQVTNGVFSVKKWNVAKKSQQPDHSCCS